MLINHRYALKKPAVARPRMGRFIRLQQALQFVLVSDLNTNPSTPPIMKTIRLIALLAALTLTVATTLQAANVTHYDSIVSLATNLTKNYTFTDPASGQGVVVAVTIAPYSPTTNHSTFQALDGNTRVGVDFGNGMANGMGANFTAALVSESADVVASSVQFGITGLGIRPADGGGQMTWVSSSLSQSVTYNTGNDFVQTLDTSDYSLNGTTYSAQIRFPTDGLFQFTDVSAPGQSVVLNATFTVTNLVDPRTNSWLTIYSGQYARIYTSDTNKTNGVSVTTWSTGNTTQVLPVYCGVQEVYSSSNWVYIRSSGLASHIMGPWYLNAAHTQAFPNYPTNEHVLYKFPRYPVVPATKTRNSGGAIGYFVDGVAMFNSWDAYSYTNGADTQGGGNGGYWNRDAYVNEGVSFDANNAHQAGGQHHYHANPPGLRYQLGDHVDCNAISKVYTESTNAPLKHSPILGWVADGFPIYGPYGYSVSNDASSGIRRMASGYVPRNGQHGNQNLTTIGRTYLPQWAVRLYGAASNVMAGPVVSTSYPLGRYMEDNDYLGDLGYQQGPNTFDLDEYNGRWCITPEFPNGTYAYFVSIASDGTPMFPYNIGRGYYGTPNGAAATSITESVTTNFLGGPEATPALNSPAMKSGTVTLTWSATEGGTYMVQCTTNFTSWTTNATSVSAALTSSAYTNSFTGNSRFFRVARTALASYDSAGAGGGTVSGGTYYVPGGIVSRGNGTNITLSITLSTGGSNPPTLPPANAPISSVTLGTLTASSSSDATQGTVIANFTIPANATTGAQNVVVTYGIPPGQTQAPTFTLTGGFTIDP